MIADLLVTVILIVAAGFLLIQLYDFYENEKVRAILIIGYGLFSVIMLFYWLAQNINQILNV